MPATPAMRGNSTCIETHGYRTPPHVSARMQAVELEMMRTLPLEMRDISVSLRKTWLARTSSQRERLSPSEYQAVYVAGGK